MECINCELARPSPGRVRQGNGKSANGVMGRGDPLPGAAGEGTRQRWWRSAPVCAHEYYLYGCCRLRYDLPAYRNSAFQEGKSVVLELTFAGLARDGVQHRTAQDRRWGHPSPRGRDAEGRGLWPQACSFSGFCPSAGRERPPDVASIWRIPHCGGVSGCGGRGTPYSKGCRPAPPLEERNSREDGEGGVELRDPRIGPLG